LNFMNATYTVAPNSTGVTRTGTLNYSSATGWSGTATITQIGGACFYNVSPTIWNADYRGQATPFFVTVESGCSVAPVITDANWVQISGVTSQIFYVQTLANATSAYRSATIQVGDQVVTIYQPPNGAMGLNGLFAHIAVGGGWDTTFQVMNASPALEGAYVDIEPAQTTPPTIPLFAVEQNQHVGGYLGSVFATSEVMSPHSLYTLLASETGSAATTIASGEMRFDSGVGAFLRFRYVPNGQEAMVPLESRQAKTFTIGFDNTNGFTTGIAIVCGAFNVGPSFSPAVSITIRDDSGKLIDSGTVSMTPGVRDSYALTDRFPSTVGKTGTIQFAATTAGQLSVIGLRYPPSLRFSTIPWEPGGPRRWRSSTPPPRRRPLSSIFLTAAEIHWCFRSFLEAQRLRLHSCNKLWRHTHDWW
jgi:hypothetical protein